MRILFLSALSLIFLATTSCNKDKGPTQAEKDEDIIVAYIEEHGLEAEPTGSGLYVQVVEEGSGSNPTLYDEVTVHYTGYLPTGEVFDLSLIHI